MKVPDSYNFPDLDTVVGKVAFAKGTGDAVGYLLYSNATKFYKVGMFYGGNNSLLVEYDKLTALGWKSMADTKRIVYLSYLQMRLKIKANKLNDAVKELENVSTSTNLPAFEIEGSGPRALEMLIALKNKNLRKRGYFSASDFNFLIELLGSPEVGRPIPAVSPVVKAAALKRHSSSNSRRTVESQNSINSDPAFLSPTGSQPGYDSNRRMSLNKPVSKRLSGRLASFASADIEREFNSEKSSSDGFANKHLRESINAIPEREVVKSSQVQINLSESDRDPEPRTAPMKKTPSILSVWGKKTVIAEVKYKPIKELLFPIHDITSIDAHAVNEYLDQQYLSWNLDVFFLTEMTGGHPLFFSGMWLLDKIGLLAKFRIDPDAFGKWLWLMESEYRPHPYHNCLHAADVLHAFNYLLLQSPHASKYNDMERLAGIIATIGHDIDHPGFTNQFLIKSRHPMAIIYSDSSVNEFHHSAHVFDRTQSSQFNIFAAVSPDQYDEMRRIIIRLIMSTDMSRHFEYLTKFKTKLQTGGLRMDLHENRMMAMEMAMKCSDLNNPSKPPQLALRWVQCIMEEFYRQGDAERELGLPISQFMDRHNANVPKCQGWENALGLTLYSIFKVGFMDILVAPLFDAWASFDADERSRSLQKNIMQNRTTWAGQSAAVAPNANSNRRDSTISTQLAFRKRTQSTNEAPPLPPPPPPPFQTNPIFEDFGSEN
ncbi:putative 3',5'-cyclic phosphodiesterase pde-4 [Blyttiomyces sp. JEL0837]|nr:putative 3',5'-cyclic phosphodiesterase pde-4 [Blyttiomyces sp. JEL0837]